MFNSTAKLYMERDSPFIQWDCEDCFQGVHSHGVCRIGKFKNSPEEVSRAIEQQDMLRLPKKTIKAENSISITDVKRVLRRIVRTGGQIRVFQGCMPGREFEMWLTAFPSAEVIIK